MSLSSNATARVVSSDLHVNRPAASSPPPPPAHGPAKPRASSYSSSALHTTTDAAAGLSIGAAAAAVDRFSPAAAQISSSSSSSISAVPSADPQSPPSPTKITTTAIATQAPATSTGTNRKRSLSPSSQEESHHHHRPSSASQPPMSSAAPRSRVVLPSTLSLDDQVALARSASNHSLEPSNYVASQEQSAATRTRSLKRASSPLPVADGGAAQTPKARKVAGALKRAHTWDSPSSGGSASLGSLALHPNVESEPESEPPEQASPTPRQPKSCDDPLSFFNLDPPSSTSLSTETATTTSPPRARRVSRMKAGAPRQPASQGPPPVRRVQSVDSGLPATGAGPLLNIINGSSMPPSSDLMTSSSCGASPNSFVGESDDPAPSGPSSPVKATATSSAVSGRQPVAAQTYSRVRSYLLSDAEDEPKSARQRDAQKDEGLSSDEDEERRDFKSIHELRAVGETARFADKMEYIFGGLELSESVNIRRASYIDLATAVTEPSFVNRSRAYGFDAKLFRAVEAEEDPFSLAIASIIILVWLSQDKKNVELCLSEVKFVGKILSCTTTAADCLIAPARSKYENRLVGDIKTILAAASSAIPFEIYPISMFSLNFASLLLLFRNPQSAPVFSSILSDPVNSQFGLKIVNLLVDLPTVAGTSERIGLAEAALEFLNVARSRPALHLQLFGAGNCIQSLSCALSKAEDANHPAVGQ
ncbi:wings apart-like protein regulation of heterochromatin-domain-containing protein [Zopfochytrium polystomum]|nr:wings apart-like protein regulation of heterochromatin-domain-containing protein [Zopfochytrium polystomum]